MMFGAFRAMLRDPESKVLALAAVGVVAIGTVVYVLIEHWSVIDAVYFCVVTLATVGYGDLHPTTDAGKIFTVLYILSGLGIIAGFITELAKHRRLLGPGIAEGQATMPAAASGRLVRENQAAPATPAPVVDPRVEPDPSSPRTDIGPGG